MALLAHYKTIADKLNAEILQIISDLLHPFRMEFSWHIISLLFTLFTKSIRQATLTSQKSHILEISITHFFLHYDKKDLLLDKKLTTKSNYALFYSQILYN